MWRVRLQKRFLKEMALLPPHIRKKVEEIALRVMPKSDPFQLGYVEKMTGYADKYKIRVGQFRIGLTIDSTNRVVLFERVADRKDIYKIFP